MNRRAPTVQYNEISLLNRLAESNRAELCVHASLLLKPFSASSVRIEEAIDYTRDSLKVSKESKTSVFILALTNYLQEMTQLYGKLSSASLREDETRESMCLEVENEYAALSNRLTQRCADDGGIEHTLLLPLRALVERCRGTSLYYAKKFPDSQSRYSDAATLFGRFGDSFGPVTEIKAYAISTVIASPGLENALQKQFGKLHNVVRDRFEKGTLAQSAWAAGIGNWLVDARRQGQLVWNATEEFPQLDIAVNWLNRMAHLRSMAIFEGNWVYAMAPRGDVAAARESSARANALVIDAYFGENCEIIDKTKTVNWYLSNAASAIPEVQNRVTRTLLFVITSAIIAGVPADEEKSELAHLLLFEKSNGVSEGKDSARRGILNVREGLQMPEVANELQRFLESVC